MTKIILPFVLIYVGWCILRGIIYGITWVVTNNPMIFPSGLDIVAFIFLVFACFGAIMLDLISS